LVLTGESKGFQNTVLENRNTIAHGKENGFLNPTRSSKKLVGETYNLYKQSAKKGGGLERLVFVI